MKRRTLAVSAVLALILAACSSSTNNTGRSSATPNAESFDESPTAIVATAGIVNKDGRVVGLATFRETRLGTRIEVTVQDLPAGKHGAHIHAAGKCDPPEFTTAGGHFNPGGAKHGLAGAASAHAGDLPNLVVESNGKGTLLFYAPHLSLNKAASNGLTFGPGTALVIHEGEDDGRTDPAGNSGARIACGIVRLNPGF